MVLVEGMALDEGVAPVEGNGLAAGLLPVDGML
jgi:hypothetical protein